MAVAPLVLKEEHFCHEEGYPGVSLLNAQRQPLGSPADRASVPGRSVTIGPGQAASAYLVSGVTACPSSEPTSVYIQVYPPGQTMSLIIPAKFDPCELQVQPMKAGTAFSSG
jgi:hypothetical protein